MVLAAAQAVNRPHEHLLARAALAGDQHGAVGGRDAAGQGENPFHRPALADNALEALVNLQLLPQDDVFADQPRVFPCPLHNHPQLRGREGLAQVVVRALFHGFDGRLDRRMTGNNHDFRRNAGGSDFREYLHAADSRHHQVDQHDVEIPGESACSPASGDWKYCTSCPSASKVR